MIQPLVQCVVVTEEFDQTKAFLQSNKHAHSALVVVKKFQTLVMIVMELEKIKFLKNYL